MVGGKKGWQPEIHIPSAVEALAEVPLLSRRFASVSNPRARGYFESIHYKTWYNTRVIMVKELSTRSTPDPVPALELA